MMFAAKRRFGGIGGSVVDYVIRVIRELGENSKEKYMMLWTLTTNRTALLQLFA
jgi:hypothetical protein